MGANITIICVEQTDEGDIFNLGLMRNIGIAYARDNLPAHSYLVFCDCDIVPRRNVDFSPPKAETAEVWFQNTGGVKCFLESALRVNGFQSTVFGWGHEDAAFWERLRRAGVHCRNWVDVLRENPPVCGGAVVLNLEWTDDACVEYERVWGHYGPDIDNVALMVGQQHPLFGCDKQIPVYHRKNWYDQSRANRNIGLTRKLAELNDTDYHQVVEEDGISCLNILEGVVKHQAFANRFPEAVTLPKSVTARNLVASSSRTMGWTPKALAHHGTLGWYYGGRAEGNSS
jgi:hypothetical protein